MKTLLLPSLALVLTACGGSPAPKHEPTEPTQAAASPAATDDVCALVTTAELEAVGVKGYEVAKAYVGKDGALGCLTTAPEEDNLSLEWSFVEPTSRNITSLDSMSDHEQFALTPETTGHLFTDKAFGHAQVVVPVAGKLLTVEATSLDDPFVEREPRGLDELSAIGKVIATVYAGASGIVWPAQTLPTGAALASKEFCSKVSPDLLSQLFGARPFVAVGYDEERTECDATPVGKLTTDTLSWHLETGTDLASAEVPPSAKDTTVAGHPAREALNDAGMAWLVVAVDGGVLQVRASQVSRNGKDRFPMLSAAVRGIAEVYAG